MWYDCGAHMSVEVPSVQGCDQNYAFECGCLRVVVCFVFGLANTVLQEQISDKWIILLLESSEKHIKNLM